MALYLVSNVEDININNIICYEKIKNNIMANSDFHKLIYSDELCTTNGIFWKFTLKNIFIEKYFNKVKCNISDNQKNKEALNQINIIEKNILLKFKENYKRKKLVFRIKEQLENMSLKLQTNSIKKFCKYDQVNFFVKISGIWEDNHNNESGLTFKFYIVNTEY